ncbi:MAG: energy transducer TonB [Proteobacteria bacterium]|nr:energy transducer TonB [Pseudomonadota bacterium]
MAMIITFPNKPPAEATPTPSVDVVFEPGAKAAAKPTAKKGVNQKAQSAAPRGPKPLSPARLAQAAPPLPPPPAPAPPPPKPAPPPPKPLPKPLPPKPAPKPLPPKPPVPALPKINLPPPRPQPPASTAQAEMNLELPPLPEFTPLPLPQPPPPLPPPPAPPQRLARRASRAGSFNGAISMNGLSFNSGGSRSGGFSHGMNLNLAEATQPGSQSDLTVKGDVGANWIAELEDWVNQRKYYPELAGEQGEQGTVVIRFTVDRAGHVSHLAMVTPTGFALLDQAWLGLFRDADLPPFPPDAKSNTATITASMRFEIIQ